jgi:aminoglycoside phosphotransferase (APT) family kinase protein
MNDFNRQEAFSGTKDVAEALTFDTARLETHLARHIPGFAGPMQVRQFKGGQSNPTYFIETPARKYVLRRKPPGKLLPSAHAVDREYKVMAALHAQNFPVPNALLYCDDESIVGTPFYVMSFEEGRIIWELHIPDSDPAERAAIYDAKNRTIAQLHSLEPSKIGLSDFGKGEDYVARQVARWTKQYVASQTDEIPEMDRLMKWLPDHLPKQQAVRVVHGDYRLDNMILHPKKPEVLAVIDWELSTLGDPLADFTYHMMGWHMPPAETGTGTGSLKGRDLKALGIPSAEEYAELYAKRTGFDPRASDRDTYMAYHFFRIAGILQGILGRVRDGTAANANAGAMSRQVRPLAQAAWHFAERAGA